MSINIGNAKYTGFTIVELLIVIVVIGILAAITTVAYNNIQTRAENTKTINGVSAFAKAFALHAADKGLYPTASGNPCLTTNNCARTIQGTPGCGLNGMTSPGATFDDQIMPYLGSKKPEISDQKISCAGDTYVGAFVKTNSTDTRNLVIRMYLKGFVECTALGSANLQSIPYRNTEITLCDLAMPSL